MIAPFAAVADDKPVSFYNDIRPLLASQCNACHKPDKNKGDLDMTTYASLIKGGKHGTAVIPGDPEKSHLIDMISGAEPDMPKEQDPLKAEQVAMLTRWVKQGAADDTPAPGTAKVKVPHYEVPPIISAMAFSPDGKVLAVGGYHEVLLHKPDGSALIARLPGECPRIESLAFSKDGKMLAVAGGAPAEFGQVQIWDYVAGTNLKTFQPSTDSLYGISFSPDGKSVAFGAADKTVRRLSVEDGSVLMEFKAHSDWALVTCFSQDGKQLVSGGRDKALKLIDDATGRFIDDINNPLEQVISLARHPTLDQVLIGGDLGTPRLYKIAENQGRSVGRLDANLVVAFERQPGPVSGVAFSPDGSHVAIGSIGEVRVYDAKNSGPKKPMRGKGIAEAVKPVDVNQLSVGKNEAMTSTAELVLSGHTGPIFAISYSPDGATIATAGFDGMVRLFDAKNGNLIKQFVPVPIEPATTQQGPETRPSAAAQ